MIINLLFSLYTMTNNFLYLIKEIQTNGYLAELLDILTIIAIFTAISVIITKNPIVSVLFLIGLFVVIAGYLILIGLSFIGLSYLLVYVGAVSILFLFILMLINVRISELLSETKNSIPLVFIIALCFNLPIPQYMPYNESVTNDADNYNIFDLFGLSKRNTIYNATSNNWDGNLLESNHISSIGNVMYSSHNIWLVIVSIILLLAMVGAIVITIKYKDYSNKSLKPLI